MHFIEGVKLVVMLKDKIEEAKKNRSRECCKTSKIA